MNLQPDINGQESSSAGIGKVLSNVGGNIFNRTLGRLFGNGLNKGAELLKKMGGTAQWTVRGGKQDFRVKVVLPTASDLHSIFFGESDYYGLGRTGSNLLSPLASTGGVIFPITPSIIINHSATYNALNLTHSNYPFPAYSHSEVPSFTVTGEFPVQNQEDARYWIAMLHFFRSVTKMFFGGKEDNMLKGNPPPILSLSGYGSYVFNNVPVVVNNFSIDLRADVDYICTTQGSKGQSASITGDAAGSLLTDKNTSWAPTLSQVTLQLQPIYSRESVKNFSLQKFINGDLNGSNGIGYI